MNKKLKTFYIIVLISFSSFAQNNFKIGDQVPEFKLWFTNGEKLTKNDIQNKVVVFKFWFTSCTPCLLDIDKLSNLTEQLKNRDDLLIIAPALDRKDIITQFIIENNIKFKVAYSAMDVSQVFNKQQVYPSYFIINKKGEFSYIDSGTKKSEFETLKNAIFKTLKE